MAEGKITLHSEQLKSENPSNFNVTLFMFKILDSTNHSSMSPHQQSVLQVTFQSVTN